MPCLIFTVFLLFGFFPGALLTGLADDHLVFLESFEKQPNTWVQLVDGAIGKAGKYDGQAYSHLRVNKKSDRISVELHFNAADVETSGVDVPDWRPLMNPEGSWTNGDFQLILREGKASAHIHNGGSDRIKLYSEKLKNNTWYKLRLDLNAKEHTATLFLDDKKVDSGKLSPAIHFFTIRAPAFGSGNRKKFRGLLDEIVVSLAPFQDVETTDTRNINQGIAITHNELYADQPLIVVTPKGTWICCLTVAPGGEGSRGQHVVAVRSTDGGKTWGDVIDIEPGRDGGGYVTPLIVPSGRVYAFYCPPYDRDKPKQDGVHNYFCYRYSDDDGQTWSKRFWLPIRSSAWDLQRAAIEAKQQIWCWCIAKPIIEGTDVFFPFAITDGVDGQGAGWIAHSNNILKESDADKIQWEILPEGRVGIYNAEFVPTQEEHCLLPLNKKDAFICVYRTRLGFPVVSYSDDRCRTWSAPQKMTYADGRIVRQPRACPMIWKCENGKYLFWGHNNSHKSFENRNPVWVSGGIERDGKVFWSQPEIMLYADDPAIRMSYPDLVEFKGEYWISETEKELPRIHRIDNDFLNGIWNRLENDLDGKSTPISKKGLVLQTTGRTAPFPAATAKLDETGGLTLDFEINPQEWKPGMVLLENRTAANDGLAVLVAENGSFRFEMNGNDPRGQRQEISWTSDPLSLQGSVRRMSIVVDNNPRIIWFSIDGAVQDGNGKRDLGWGRFWLAPKEISGTGTLKIHSAVKTLRVYNRRLNAFEL